jgi:hypothetical protein
MVGEGEMWDEFLAAATEYLQARQDWLRDEFGLGEWPRWDYDQPTATLRFSADGKTGVVADMQVVGSTSTSSGTWLWSWANDSILAPAMGDMERVRAYGEAHGFDKLVQAKWPGDESDGWEMTAAAAYILQAEGGYRAPHERGALFMIMRQVRRVT